MPQGVMDETGAEAALRLMSRELVDLGEQLERYMATLKFSLENIQNQAAAFHDQPISPQLTKQIIDIGKALDHAVSSYVRYRKNELDEVKKLSVAQKLEAAMHLVLSCEQDVRHEWLLAAATEHRRIGRTNTGPRMNPYSDGRGAIPAARPPVTEVSSE